MKVLVTGATGFIGSQLTKPLLARGDSVIALTRNPVKAREIFGSDMTFLKWNGEDISGWVQEAEGADAIVNLVGESIAGLRWTKKKKQKIESSRVQAGRAIFEAVKQWKQRPSYMIQVSAIGFYGNRKTAIDETSGQGKGFLSEVSRRWEESSSGVEELGVKRSIVRIGAVLGKNGGILKQILLPFRLGLGGPVGSGEQGVSWIHVEDVTGAMVYLLDKRAEGIFNLTAPSPVTMNEFTRTLAGVLNRPHWIPVPAPLLKLAGGEMAEELILSGAMVFPKRLLDLHYKFKYNSVESALNDLVLKN